MLRRRCAGERGWLGLTALGFGVAAAAAVPAASAAGSGVLSNCGFAALRTAVAAGGTIDYGADCTVTFRSTLSVPSGRTVDIEANGHVVTFDGGSAVRLFSVSGGGLTIGGIELRNGVAAGSAGARG